jgi:hypothetical protein
MRRRARLFSVYWLSWAAVLLSFGLAVWWVLAVWLHGPRFTEVKPEEVRSTAVPAPNPESQSIGDTSGPLKMNVKQAELSLSSGDGALKMRLWAAEAGKQGDYYNIDEGTLEFTMKDRNTLLLRVTDAEYRRERGVATVSGTLVGSIEGTGQYFSAERLSWDQAGHTVTTETVRYVGPHVDVTGQQMRIDMNTGTVTFEGPVEAAI